MQFKKERLSDYRERFLLLFQSSDSQVTQLADVEAQFDRAESYNRAAIKNADLMILRVLTMRNGDDPIATAESPMSSKSGIEVKQSHKSSLNEDLLPEEVAILRDSQDINDVSFESSLKIHDPELASVRLEEAQRLEKNLVNTMSYRDSNSLMASGFTAKD